MARSRRVDRTAARGLVPCVFALLALYGCGGESGSADQPQPASPPPPQSPPSSAPPPVEEPPPPQPPVTGAATVTWTPPTSNEDGSVLADLAGFRIHYGTSADALDSVIDIDNAGLTSYVVENLTAATWYFAVQAFTASGEESALSNIASKTLR